MKFKRILSMGLTLVMLANSSFTYTMATVKEINDQNNLINELISNSQNDSDGFNASIKNLEFSMTEYITNDDINVIEVDELILTSPFDTEVGDIFGIYLDEYSVVSDEFDIVDGYLVKSNEYPSSNSSIIQKLLDFIGSVIQSIGDSITRMIDGSFKPLFDEDTELEDLYTTANDTYVIFEDIFIISSTTEYTPPSDANNYDMWLIDWRTVRADYSKDFAIYVEIEDEELENDKDNDEEELEDGELENDKDKDDEELEDGELENDKDKDEELEDSELENDKDKDEELEDSELENDKDKDEELEDSELENDKDKDEDEELEDETKLPPIKPYEPKDDEDYELDNNDNLDDIDPEDPLILDEHEDYFDYNENSDPDNSHNGDPDNSHKGDPDKNTHKVTTIPKTGDNAGILFMIFALSMLYIAFCILKKFKKDFK